MTLPEALALAEEFDRQRNCCWNSQNDICGKSHEGEEFCATHFPEFARMGNQCSGTLLQLALLNTLRPCKKCGSDHLYFGYYKVACCICLGDRDECEDCQNGGCGECAENANLPDAITRWNLCFAAQATPRGLVTVIG